MDRIGLCFLDRPDLSEQLRLARRADEQGFESVWVCETRLARDAISVLGAMAAITSRVKLGPGVVNTWTRGPALMALSFATLDELAPDRMICGLGAYWDPLAWKQGIERTRLITQMREYVDVVKRLFNMEEVTLEGEVVHVRGIRLDLGDGRPKTPKHIPIYIGATGMQMLELSGKIADGVLLNAMLSTDYVRACIAQVEKGARAAGRSLDEIDLPLLVSCALDEDGDKARYAGRRLATMYVGQQPHIAKASGIDEDLIHRVNEAMGGWPPKEGGIEAAMTLIDEDLALRLTASGTPDECRARLRAYQAAGASYPVILPVTHNVDAMIEAFAPEQSLARL
ncbi:MAG TPA: LLM class flavin-dependent oxidoreductase [Candidatus Limnocylindrales bacterium]|nr:LLM class flavin-dependent oxidoreductase [Candidatus Limnocylindrales bacterium]